MCFAKGEQRQALGQIPNPGENTYFKVEEEGSYLKGRRVPTPLADQAKSLFHKKYPRAVLSSLPTVQLPVSLERSEEAS